MLNSRSELNRVRSSSADEPVSTSDLAASASALAADATHADASINPRSRSPSSVAKPSLRSASFNASIAIFSRRSASFASAYAPSNASCHARSYCASVSKAVGSGAAT